MMQRPRFKNEFNYTSLVALFTLVTAIFAGGIAWQSQKNASERNSVSIQQLRKEVDGLQSDSRAYSSLKFRVDMLESGATSTATATRELEHSVNELKSDIRVIREIVERMDVSETRRRTR